MNGIVKFYSKKGYGFISGNDGNDYFFHISELNSEIKQDDKVEFEPTENSRGKSAKNVNCI